jgi:hypothetical protein
VAWNAGLLIAIYLYSDADKAEFTSGGGLLTSVVLISASIFAFTIALSDTVRNKLLEPSRAHNFRKKDFHFLGFVTLVISISMYWLSGAISI